MTRKGKTVLITGSTDGVGRYVAERLAANGWRVIVHGRDRTRGEAVVKRITKQGGEVRFLAADLSSLAEVRSLADAVRRDGDGLDALVNNAGIGTSGERRELSADSFELRFAVNYLSGFLLTRLLLPMLESRKSARIVNVSSAGQQAIDFSDVMLTRGYSGVRAYCQSKLAQILFTVDLADELCGTRRHGQLPASRDLHGPDYGSFERGPADEHGGARRRGDSAARRVAGACRQKRALFQRHAGIARRPPSLRRARAQTPARAELQSRRAPRSASSPRLIPPSNRRSPNGSLRAMYSLSAVSRESDSQSPLN
jgi:NAD(P)-dependent dehydrogenase (short-subunit alcohol dehydrogenase family)